MNKTIPTGLLMLALAAATALAQGTTFTYQGRLNGPNGPATGLYDFSFHLFPVSAGGLALTASNGVLALPVTNGLFTATLNFGNQFSGADRWLEIAVRTNGGAGYAILSPRQPLTPAPYAISAGGVGGALRVQPNGSAPSLIGGAANNFVASGVLGATIGGGGDPNNVFGAASNVVAADFGTVGGGLRNAIQSLSSYSFVGGGFGNTVQSSASLGTIAGGQDNRLETGAFTATIGGGNQNVVRADWGTIGGGQGNVIDTNAHRAVIPGGHNNRVAGPYGFASGRRAKALHDGSFVWADATDADFTSTASNQFLVRATGGVGIGLPNPAAQLEVSSGGDHNFPQARLNQTNAPDYARLRFTVGGDFSKRWDVAARSNAFVIYSGLNGTEALRLETNNATVPGTVTAGGFAGGGAALTGLNAAQIASGTVADARLAATIARTSQVWLLGGNAGTVPGTHFLGTTDPVPLELRMNNKAVMRYSFAPGLSSPNLVGGVSANSVAPNVEGATIAGGGQTNEPNIIMGHFGTIGGGRANTIYDFGSDGTIAGGHGNTVGGDAEGATISGGRNNWIGGNGTAPAIGGGIGNTIEGDVGLATISGGYSNTIKRLAHHSIIGGGASHSITGQFSSVVGGLRNSIKSEHAFIGGGASNLVEGGYGAIGGGTINTNRAWHATVGGGTQNLIDSDSGGSTIAGGAGNAILLGSGHAAISGGLGNIIFEYSGNSVIAGGVDNDIRSGADTSFIGGGFGNGIGSNSWKCFIGGGDENDISANSRWSTIAGGHNHWVRDNAYGAAIGGGTGHEIFSGSDHSTIPGGYENKILTNSPNSAIGGGVLNLIGVLSAQSTIAGGWLNGIGTNSPRSTIGGGDGNQIQNGTAKATLAGGSTNRIQGNSSAATISGGELNVVTANASYATIPGGLLNTATNHAFAAGRRAKAVTTGSFVWGDSTDADFASTSFNQFLLRATGGVGIGLNNPQAQLEVSSSGGDSFPQARINQTDTTGYSRLRFTVGGDTSKRWDLASRSNAFVIYSGQTSTEALRLENNNAYVNGALVLTSDRNAKENFSPVDTRAALEKVAALPMQEWNYRTDTKRTRHLGPMAQDFHAAFGLGTDDKHIATVDADGVALAAIQGLNQVVKEAVKEKDAEIRELKDRLAALESLVKRLATE